MDDETLQAFLGDGWEHLSALRARLEEIAERPHERDRWQEPLERLRTITGTCGFLGLNHIGAVARDTTLAAERLHSGDAVTTPTSLALVHAGVDRLEALLTTLEATRVEPDAEFDGLQQTTGPLGLHAPEVGTEVDGECHPAERECIEGSEMSDGGRWMPIDATVSRLVGDLGVVRDDLVELALTTDDARFDEPVSRLDRITADLADSVGSGPSATNEEREDDVDGEIDDEFVELSEPVRALSLYSGGEDDDPELAENTVPEVVDEEAEPVDDGALDAELVSELLHAHEPSGATVLAGIMGDDPDDAPDDGPDDGPMASICDASSDIAASPNAAEPSDDTNFVRPTALVIDDSLFFRQLAATVLEQEGYAIQEAEDAEVAMRRLETESFDVVICDIEMPGTTGLQFAEWFTAREGAERTALVAMTSLDSEHGPQILAAGFQRHLEKFHARELVETLEELRGGRTVVRS